MFHKAKYANMPHLAQIIMEENNQYEILNLNKKLASTRVKMATKQEYLLALDILKHKWDQCEEFRITSKNHIIII